MNTAAAARALHVMAKPTGAVCNLDCAYCYFLSKEVLYPDSEFRMSDRVLERYVRQVLAGQPDADEVVVAFQGGEPTMMGIDFFQRALALERRYARPGQQVSWKKLRTLGITSSAPPVPRMSSRLISRMFGWTFSAACAGGPKPASVASATTSPVDAASKADIQGQRFIAATS